MFNSNNILHLDSAISLSELATRLTSSLSRTDGSAKLPLHTMGVVPGVLSQCVLSFHVSGEI